MLNSIIITSSLKSNTRSLCKCNKKYYSFNNIYHKLLFWHKLCYQLNKVKNMNSKITFISILLIVFSSTYLCKEDYIVFNDDSIAYKTKKIVYNLCKEGYIQRNSNCEDGSPTEQYLNIIKLSKISSKEDLIKLCKHKKPIVKCFAFWALTKKNINPKTVDSIIKQNILNTSKIEDTHYFNSKVNVGDFFFYLIEKGPTNKKYKKIAEEAYKILLNSNTQSIYRKQKSN